MMAIPLAFFRKKPIRGESVIFLFESLQSLRKISLEITHLFQFKACL
jgi:hypothetical protein